MTAHLLTHNPRESQNPALAMMDFRAGETSVFGRWSVGKAFSIAPGDRLFFYRSTVEPRGIFAVGVALPADIPEAREWRGISPVPVKHGLAVYKAPHWEDPREDAFYINAEWQMMSDPEEGRILIPFERLRDEEPFSRVFTKIQKGQVMGHAPQASGSPISNAEVAEALYSACAKEFPLVLREYGDTPLHIAAWSNTPEIKSLLSDGADLTVRNKDGHAPLDMAARGNAVEAIATLLENGADINAQDENGFAAIHDAAEKNACNAIVELAKRGANVNMRNNDRDTPMHMAAGNNACGAIEELAKHGGEVNTQNGEKLTPLHLASTSHSIDAIALLVKLGVDPNACDIDGQTPLDLAEREKAEKSAAMLRELGGKRGAEL